MENELHTALGEAISQYIPEDCPFVETPQGGPQVEATWIIPLTAEGHFGQADITCNQPVASHPICQGCQLREGVVIEIEQNSN